MTNCFVKRTRRESQLLRGNEAWPRIARICTDRIREIRRFVANLFEMMKVAVIGVGHLGKHHARLYAEMPGTELVGVVDILRTVPLKSLRLTTPRHGLTTGTSSGRSMPLVLQYPQRITRALESNFLQNGIDLLVEKPIAATLDEARLLIDTARSIRLSQEQDINMVVTVIAVQRPAHGPTVTLTPT